ncbi:MAG: ABC transporter substrate-binding protein [Promethearchaeota archaeon]
MSRLTIGYLSTAYHTAFILKGGKWIKKRLKINPEWKLFPTGPAMVQAFSKGELDLGYIGLPPAMIGIDRGLKIKCVAGGHVEGTVIIALSKYQTFEELGTIESTLDQFRGHAIGTPSQGSIHDVILRWLIDGAGLTEKINIKNFRWADFILEALEDKVVVGGCGTPPLAVLASKYLDAKIVLPPHEIWPYNPSYGIVATIDIIKNASETLSGFLRLHEEANNLMRDKPYEAVKLAAEEIGIVDEEFLLQVLRVSPKYCASLPKEYTESTLAFVPILRKMGYISKHLDYNEVFHPDLINQIHKENPHYGNPGKLG